ncbi:MAG: TlpA family protein disulfide reductase [Saprospiraceae bacterium]|nr:TlpA family protein disulfide reductase [Saprospiraceae bacterium]
MLKKTNLFLILAIALFFGGRYLWMKPKFDPGQKAPLFSAPMPDGGTLNLADYSGKYVLLDFWGSWCGPCRAESPNLVRLYREYQPKGLEIVSISLERSANNWKRAIQKDGLYWDDHASNLQRMKDPIAKMYGVREIPTKYLINPEGYIIATNPTFAQLESTLDEVLTK